MGDIFYGMDRGDQEHDIVTDTSGGGGSPTKDVEIVVDDAVSLTKGEVILMLKQMINHILKEDDY